MKERTMEVGECSGSGSDSSGDNIWAQLVPLDSHCMLIELRLNEVPIGYKSNQTEIEWCRITRNNDQVSALLQNKSSSLIVVDDTIVLEEGQTIIIRCGDKIILGPDVDGLLQRYRFRVMHANETSNKELKITLDPEHAKCSICLNVWHDVVTVAPCFHNFCKGCLSKWSRTCEKKQAKVVCPQCRSTVTFVGRNHFLHSIEENIMQFNSSIRRSTKDALSYLPNSMLPPYYPTSPSYSPASLLYFPRSPPYFFNSLPYCPTPSYLPNLPSYCPISSAIPAIGEISFPGYSSSIPTSPAYTTTSPSNMASPAYTPTSPHYMTLPIYNPTPPSYMTSNTASPDYTPTSPNYMTPLIYNPTPPSLASSYIHPYYPDCLPIYDWPSPSDTTPSTSPTSPNYSPGSPN